MSDSALDTIRIFFQVPLLTLASGASISLPFSQGVQEDFRLFKLEAWLSVEAKTAGEGPLLFGINDGELSVSEISEAIVAHPLDMNDRLNRERASRPVWELAMLDTPTVGGLITPNGGNGPLVWKPKGGWTFSDSEGLDLFCTNLDDATLTTGCIVKGHVKVFRKWLP